jgi:uncharacterized protein YndB with AHSA1/START domain
MNEQGASRFIYALYIKTTPEKLWQALTDPATAAKYWRGARPEAEWRAGGAWRLVFPDGRLADSGEIIECQPPSRLVIRWRNEWSPEFAAEGWSRCAIDIEPYENCVKLTVDHSIERANSGFIGAVSGGWPQILSGLKSLLETGETLLPPMKFAAKP